MLMGKFQAECRRIAGCTLLKRVPVESLHFSFVLAIALRGILPQKRRRPWTGR